MASRQPVIWWSLRCFTLLCGALRHDTAVKLGGFAGKAIGFFSFSRKARARSRVVRILGVTDKRAREIIRGVYEHFGKALVEFIRLPRMYGNIDEFVAVQGEENIRKALSMGHGAIFLSAHIGCWEYGAAVLAKHGVPMNALGTEQRDERITKAITDMRSLAGVKPVGKGMDLRAALNCLKKNEVLAVLLDQDAKDGGILSPFLGHLASTPFGLIKIVHRYGIPVVPVHITRDGDGRRMTMIIEAPLEGRNGRPFGEDIKYAVDKCNEKISGWIREKPEQWMWTYPRWESTTNDK
ncbi:MAG: lysophospholipid acyltransferase family protein [Synergistaceae bacterium]|jgi:KDO2-lipid IV(A) lauroyltransferase|nr:lysophospholipid acyltransferase family protein [Synergistaceae bacterium]